MRKQISAVLFLSIIFSVNSFCQNTKLTEEIISSVKVENLKKYVSILSGDTSVTINNKTETIYSRFVGETGNKLAEQFISNELKSFGLEVFTQDVNSIVNNVFAVQPGKDNSKTVMISAHFDDCGNRINCNKDSMSYSPGADDNASGVAAVLECARILSKYYTNNKIIYSFWDSEEQYFVGSGYYVINHQENIISLINLDMIGWDSNNDGLVEIHAKDSISFFSPDLPSVIKETNKNFNIGLKPVIYAPGTYRSDHYPFWWNNVNAVLLIEGLFSGDFNEYYHSPEDKLANLNHEYFFRTSTLAIASTAVIAGIIDYKINIPPDYYLSQNYPNPFNSETTINYSIPIDDYVSVKVYNILGQLVSTLVSEYHNPGKFSVKFNSQNLPSGVYIYTVETTRFKEAKKMMVLK
ncbi:MAG: hypothetical protein A2068_11910 [Ignavibacteria bacterium GWB2_35_6b]|nr:MAG: hypothetical protein A2068_11910 [Ignavibacteria bacterium GWB2_35_6b]